MGDIIEGIGCIVMMFSGMLADSENLIPFAITAIASVLIILLGNVINTIRRRRKNGKYNYYLRKSY